VNATVDLHSSESLLWRSTVMFQAQNRETVNSTWKVAVSFKTIMTANLTRPRFTTQHQTCKSFTTQHQTCKTKTDFFLGLVLRRWSQTTLLGCITVMSALCCQLNADTLLNVRARLTISTELAWMDLYSSYDQFAGTLVYCIYYC